jgi:hypothetical protein
MWVRNLLFVSLCLIALAGLAASLLHFDRQETPAGFEADRYEQDSYRHVIEQVNAEWREHWVKAEVQSAPRADDLTIARRLALSLSGTVPSLEEIRRLEELPSEERLEWQLSSLLVDQRYADYLAERLARTYVGTENGPFLSYRRRRFLIWLAERLHENTPYDEIVRPLICDDGLWTDSPAVNFVTVTLDQNNDNQPDPIRLAARTTRAFLGIRIDCLQCHDNNMEDEGRNLGTEEEPREGLQRDFHQLAAFFSETQSTFFGVKDNNKEEYKVTYLGEIDETEVPAVPPFSEELLIASGTRRQRLAEWVTHPENKPFARAFVNRIWALMFGKPLVEPIDDIPLFGKYPPGLETLAADFTANKYDLQRLIRVIAGTEVYQCASRADFEIEQKHEDNWAVFPLTRLRPEQVAGGIIQSASLKTIDANSNIFAKLGRFGSQNEFIKRYGDTGEDEFDERAGTIAQRLLMMNGRLVKDRTKQDLINNAATKIAQLSPSSEKAVETAYLTTLTRRPSKVEMEHFTMRLDKATGDSRIECLEDLYWVLLNSTEFSWNH